MALIDRDALIEEFRNMEGYYALGEGQEPLSVKDIVEVINDADSVDAVPVVRCKDCDFYGTYKALPAMCAFMERKMSPDGFCSEAMNCGKEVQRHYYAGFADAKMDGETK